MDDKYIKDIYDNLGGESVFGKYDDYYSLITTDDSYINDVYKSQGESVFGSYDDFVSLVKKKDELQPTSQEVATESITKEEKQPTLSDASKSKFDYESFIDKDEEDAISDLQSQLTGKGYSVEETGMGDALLVTDNITGEVTEIDLQPIEFFKGTRSEEIEKVKKLIQTPADSRRSLLSTNQLEAYTSDKASYLQNLKSQYPNFQFEYVQDPQRGGTIRITKGDAVGEFEVKRGAGSESKQFTAINNFLYQNMTDEEASALNNKRKIDEFRRIEEDVKNITADIDVSIESAEASFYDKNYFKGLFKALEAAGVSVPEEARRELEAGEKIGEYNPKLDKMMTSIFDRNDIEAGIEKYFGSDPDTMEKINQYNLAGTIAVRNQKIDRAKKLAIENYYEDRSDRDNVKEIVRQVQKDLTDQEADIFTNVEMAKGDLQKMVSGINQEMKELSERNPGVKFQVITNEDGVLQNIISSEPVEELDEVKNRIKNATTAYRTLVEKSKYELDKVNSKSETVDQFMEAANRNYNLFDTAIADLKNAFTQLGGGIAIIQTLAEGAIEDITGVPVGLTPTSAMIPADVKMKMIRGEMAESREKVEKFYKTKRTYDEAVAEGSKFEFGVRTFSEQAPNIALAIGTSGVGTSVGLSNAAVSTLVATQFGLTSAGQKYDQLTTRQEFGAIAEKALKELESIKGIISDEEYLIQKYELERAKEDSKISSWEKTGSVIGTGLVEGVITRFIGTVPNSIKVLKDLRAPTKFMDDILRSNYTSAKQAVKEFGKRTGGEMIEETSIDLFTQINDYAFLGDQINLSSLDDVAVTAIITSGAMNTPSTAYSTIMTQTNVNRYKNKINSLTQEIGTLKDMLMDPDISNIQRTAIHNNINKLISGIAEQTTNMEGDALLMGADNIKEMLTLSGVRNSMLKKAGVENDDSYDIANVKIDNYLKGLDQDAAKKFTDQMKYIDSRRNEILKSINYEGAVERVFGEKGTEIAKDLDPNLTPQQKYVEVYKQVRQEINDNALKEFNDAIQKQETGDISDAKPAEGVQEVEEEVRVSPEKEAEVETTQKVEPLKTTEKEKVDPVVQEYLDELNKYRRAKTKNAYDLDEKKITQEQYEAENKRLNKELTATQKRLKMDNKKAGIDTRNENWDKKIKENLPESNISTSEDLNKKLEEGTWGMLTAENPNADIVTDKQNENANKRAEKWLKSKGYSFTKIFGKYGNSEQSYLVDGLTREDAIEFAKEFSQESVATNEGLVYQDGSMNPKVGQSVNINEKDLYSTIKTSDGLVDFKVEYDFSQRTEPTPSTEGVSKLRGAFGRKAAGAMRVNTLKQKLAIEQQAEEAKKAIAKRYPNMKIEVFYNEADYHRAIGEADQSKGTYFNNKVYINLTRATETTVAHEVFHGILSNEIKSNAQVQALMKRFVDSLSRSQDPALVAVFAEEAAKVERYKDVQNEEIMAELFGTLAGENLRLRPETKSLIKRFLDKLAKLLGLKKFTDAEVIDVLNTLAGKIATGQEVTTEDASLFKGGKVVDSPVQAITNKSVGGFDVQYTENARRQELIDKGLLVEVNDVSGLAGNKVAITSPDDMLAGTISIDGKQIFEGGGGIFFVTKYGDVWASGKKGTANTLSKMINESLKVNGEKGFLVLTKGADQKLISSVSGVNSSLSILDVMLDKGLISPSDFRSAVSGSVKKAGGIIKLGGSAKQLKSDVNKYFSDPTTTTFEKRGSVVKDIIGRLAQLQSVKQNSKQIIDLLGGDTTKKLGVGNTKLSQSLGDLIAGVAAEQLTKGLSVGDVYGVIEVNGEVEVVEDSHPSYPFHVKLKDGSRPKLILPKNRQNGSDILKTSTGKTYRVGNVSVLSGSFNTDIKPMKQVSGRPSIDEIRQYAKENKISDADVRTFLKEVGYTEDQIKVAMKKAPSVKKILGKKPIKKTVDTYAALKDQIRLESRAAREAQKDLNTKRKELASMIKDLAGKGVITANQSTVLINRVSSVNLNNERSLEKLVEYMDKVYQNAEYADNILRSNKGRKRAKKNIRSKIGSANVVFNTLKKLFSIDAKLIPQDVLDTYNDLVTQFGESRAVLNLEDISVINEKANSILEAIDNEISEIPKLQLLFNDLNKISVKGKEDFSATIAQALSNGEITQQDYDLMKKYKKDIVPAIDKVEVETEPITFEFKENNVEDSMENEGAERLIELLKNKKAVEQLSDDLKRNIQAVIDNIDAGFFPSYANNIANEIESIIAKDNVVPRIKKGKYVFDRVTAKIKNFFSSKRSKSEYQIRQNPLSDIDNVLGNMNRTDIYDNIFGKAAKSYANLDAQIDIIHEKIAEADALLFKQFKRNGNKVTESKFKIMAYMLEREFQSNKDSNKVFSAKDAINAAIESQKKGETTIYSKKDIKILESILKEFEGDVNLDSVFNKFSKREQKAISIIDEVNKSIADKALYTASVIRGARPNMIENYVHHSVASSDENTVESITSKYNQFKTFSTKAGTLVERTPGVKPLNFDVLNSTLKGAKETLTDYHMTDTARVIFKTLNKIQADILADENSTDRQIETANALKKAFDTAMRQVFEMNYVNNGMNFLGKAKGLGYKALLASVPRAAAEMSSNFAYVLSTSPKSWTVGAKYTEYTLDQIGRDIMINLNSEQTGKLYSKKVTGKTADVGLFVDSEGATPTGAVNGLQNKANQILSYLSKVTIKPTEKIAESLISTPDRAISRPLWFGSLDTKFKEITGKKIDMEAIRNGDKNYLKENKEALKEATRFADKEVTRAATSINVFNGVLKNKIDPNDSSTLKIVKEINGFMTNFMIYEYTTARSAISAIINSGQISRQKGASLLLGTTARMSLYMVLYQSFSHLFDSVVAAIAGADIGDEEMPEEDLLARQLVGSIVSLIVGKNLGNFAKIVPNIALENVNEKYLEDLRNGEDYDPYKHSIAYSMLSREDLKKIETGQAGVGDVLLKAFSGPYSPTVKTLTRAGKLVAKVTSEKSKDATKQKAIEELTSRIVIEMLGNMGMIPFYKDVRRIVIKDFFNKEPELSEYEKRPRNRIIRKR